MTVYTVQPGDTIYTIAEKFNVPYMRLVQQNNIYPNYDLVTGQNILITYPDKVHNVRAGDTLQSIANTFGISTLQVLQNNPQLSDRDYLVVDEEVIISYTKENRTIEVNGYAFSYISVNTLKKTLPFLTYLTITNYTVTATGDILYSDNTSIINLAKEYGVAPIMMLSTMNLQGQGSYGITHNLLNNPNFQNNLIDKIITILRQDGLSGVNFGFQFILEEDFTNYINFIAKAKYSLQDEGYIIFVTCIPEIFGFEPDGNNETTFFSQVGQVADRVILMSYQWSYAYIPAVERTTVKYIDKYVQYIITQIPPEKILVGFTRVAYDFELPYVDNSSRVNSLTNFASIFLAKDMGVNIYFDEETQTPYFYYTDLGIEHFVWFKDAKSIISILGLVYKYNLGGISIWGVMDFGTQTWTIINSSYNIAKILNVTSSLLTPTGNAQTQNLPD
jgi:Predicted glycosyl hydrolase